MASNCKIITNKCGIPRQVCWTRSGKIKSNRAVMSAMGVQFPAPRVAKKFVAKTACLTSTGKLKKGFRFVDGRCKQVGTPGMRGVRRRRRRGVGCGCA